MEHRQRQPEPASPTSPRWRGLAILRGPGREKLSLRCLRCFSASDSVFCFVSFRFALLCFVFKCEEPEIERGFLIPVCHRTPRHRLAQGITFCPLPSPRVEAPEEGCNSRSQGVGKAPSDARALLVPLLAPAEGSCSGSRTRGKFTDTSGSAWKRFPPSTEGAVS